MKEIEFNLLDEPWIRVMKSDCSVEEVSLTNALLHAHEYEDLAGELPTQDIAVLRVLLAVLHTVFSRVDPDGNQVPLDEDNALERWGNLWNLKVFPEKPIREYLNQWHERFWLFHPERPFFQVPSMDLGHTFKVKKLNGVISESDNKKRLFSSRYGFEKTSLSYAEATRWMISINAFDDNVGAKPVPTGKNMPPCGVGWLGQLGLIVAQGKNLFETLLLNLVFLKNGNKEWGEGIPVWEKTNVEEGQHIEISIPKNPSELYTLQSRRLLLIRSKGRITDYKTLGGDFFNVDLAFPWEPMTLWRIITDKQNNITGYKPYLHDKAKQIWRIFPIITGTEQNVKLSGLVSWITYLIDEIPDMRQSMISFKIASVVYGGGSQKSSVENIFSDFLTFHAGLLAESGKQWQARIKSELNSIDEIARLVWRFASDLQNASGGENGEMVNRAKEQYYYRINEPFRTWLTKLSSDQSPEEKDQLELEWRNQAISYAKLLGKELVDETGPKAFSGRKVTDKNNKVYFYSAPEAYNMFIYRLNHIYDSKGA